MKVLISGATGLVGTHLVPALVAQGHEVSALVTDETSAVKRIPLAKNYFQWEASQRPPAQAFQDVEAVIHLAGAPVARRLWTSAEKKRIHDSRVYGMRNIVRGLVMSPNHKVKCLVSASAVGYYGDKGDRILTENDSNGEGFLASVCRHWERELFHSSTELGRKVALRCGLVLSQKGGILKKLEPSFRWGLGSVMGHGQQWVSWIHINDLVRMYIAAIEDSQMHGPINATAPGPVKNQDFAKNLGYHLRRPVFLRVPKFAVERLPFQMHELFAFSQRAVPQAMLDKGFVFEHPTLDMALRDLYDSDRQTTKPRQTIRNPRRSDFLQAQKDQKEHYDIDGISHRHGKTFVASDKRPVEIATSGL